MKHGLALITLLAVTSSATAQTQFYKCKDKWGQPVFSQRPCGDSAESGTIAEPQYSGSSAETAPAHAAPETVGSTTWDKIEASNALRQADREIKRREGRFRGLEAEREQKIAALQNKKSYANNNLAGATWEESISSEMRAVNEQHQSKIDSERRNIDRLQELADRVSKNL